jgi:hypothetical protein
MILITVTTFRSCHVLVINLKAFFLLPSTAEEAPLKPYRRRSSPQPQGLSRPPPAAAVVLVLPQRDARSLLSPPRPQSLAIGYRGTSLFDISTISGCVGAHPARHRDPLCCLIVFSCCSARRCRGNMARLVSTSLVRGLVRSCRASSTAVSGSVFLSS